MLEPIVEVVKTGLLIFTLLNPTAGDRDNRSYANVPVFCMAQNIYHEARGESRAGKIAVAHVTLNRVRHSSYPNTICGVVYDGPTYTGWKGNVIPVKWKCQFHWYCDGKSDDTANKRAWENSLSIALLVMTGAAKDPTHGATHYWNPDKVQSTPNWNYPITVSIGNHIFCKKPSRA